MRPIHGETRSMCTSLSLYIERRVRASAIKDPIICYHQGSLLSLNTMFHGSAIPLAECKRINESIPGVRVSIRSARNDRGNDRV